MGSIDHEMATAAGSAGSAGSPSGGLLAAREEGKLGCSMNEVSGPKLWLEGGLARFRLRLRSSRQRLYGGRQERGFLVLPAVERVGCTPSRGNRKHTQQDQADSKHAVRRHGPKPLSY